MNQILWTLALRLALALAPSERDGVLGDLLETRATGYQAFRALLGLVARRQAALWRDWRPWLAMLGISIPAALLLDAASITFFLGLDRQLITYWKYDVIYNDGLTMAERAAVLSCHVAVLIAWSWTAGYVLGVLSRRAIWITGAVGALIWFCPLAWIVALRIRAIYEPPQHPLDTSLAALATSVAALLHTALILIPAASGTRHGVMSRRASGRTLAISASTLALTVAFGVFQASWSAAAMARWSEGVWTPTVAWQYLLIPALLAGPACYMLGAAVVPTRAKQPAN